MHKTVFAFVMAFTLILTLVGTSSAQASLPVGECPQGFMLMEVMAHDEMEHNHIGLQTDINQDGYLCVRHVTSGNHVHVDNYVTP